MASAQAAAPGRRREPGRPIRILWYALLFSIPVTSFPPLSSLTGGSLVAPLSGVFLILLIVFWLLPNVLRGESFPGIIIPLITFVLIAVISSSASFFLEIHPYLEQTPLRRVLRAGFTLVIGIAFYLITIQIPRSNKLLRNTLLWIYLGGIIQLIWSTVQGVYVLDNYIHQVRGPGEFPASLNSIQMVFSTHSLYVLRVTGLALEPSWLADQLVLLYLPLWMASFLSSYSVFTTRRTRLSIEMLLLLWGSVILFLSQSRIGYVSFSVVVIAVGISVVRALEVKLAHRIVSTREGHGRTISPRKRRLLSLGLWLIFICLMVFAALLLFLALIRMDPRIETVVKTSFSDLYTSFENPWYVLASKMGVAERVMYWASGLKTFAQHPIFGVGLGNVGFFIERNLPSFGSRLPEIIEIMNGWVVIPNSKSLWVRLLAETGITGFMVIVIWLVQHALNARRLQRSKQPIYSMIGLTGLLALLAQSFEGFSLDTFALPQLWIVLGLVVAASVLSQVEPEPPDIPS